MIWLLLFIGIKLNMGPLYFIIWGIALLFRIAYDWSD